MIDFDWPDRTGLACLLESLDAAGVDGGDAEGADGGRAAPNGTSGALGSTAGA